MTGGITCGNRKRKFTIVEEICLKTTFEERNQPEAVRKVNLMNTINSLVRSRYRGPCIIEKVFLDGKLVEMDYVCRNAMP